MGQNPNASQTLVCQLPPAADIRRIGSGPLRANRFTSHCRKNSNLSRRQTTRRPTQNRQTVQTVTLQHCARLRSLGLNC
jgi:hypothetical protein